jgi:hypothetical protein
MNILTRAKHNHPLIYLRGIMSKDLAAVLDFMYHGQVNVYQEDLTAFLALAQELQLKGLQEMSQGEGGQSARKRRRAEAEESGRQGEEPMVPEQEELEEPEPAAAASSGAAGIKVEEPEVAAGRWPVEPQALWPVEAAAYPFDPPAGYFAEQKVYVAEGGLEELDMQIAAMMEWGEDKVQGAWCRAGVQCNPQVWTCKVCGKKATRGGKPDMRDHIEANHVEGVSHPCSICGKTYKSVTDLPHIGFLTRL